MIPNGPGIGRVLKDNIDRNGGTMSINVRASKIMFSYVLSQLPVYTAHVVLLDRPLLPRGEGVTTF
jgi:hypothetical protein